MPLRDDLLIPIPGPNPAGADIWYTAARYDIEEARREEFRYDQDGKQHQVKAVDWAAVGRLAGDVLATQSKDLRIAAWLVEALLRREGIGGLRSGLGLLTGLLERFWDRLFPEPEEGDVAPRTAPLNWVGGRHFAIAVKLVPLNAKGQDFFKYAESRDVGYEAEADDADKQEQRNSKIQGGRISAEVFDQAVDDTPKTWYKELAANLDGCLENLQSLEQLGEEKFGDLAPGYTELRDSLEAVRRATRELLRRKWELDPDLVESHVARSSSQADVIVQTGGVTATHQTADAATRTDEVGVHPGGSLPAEPASFDDATAFVVGAARFLRRTEPRSPAPYLLLRGLRWGELRAHGEAPNPKLLEAPPTRIRAQLKGLLLDGKWLELLEAAEGVMGTPHGRGWLDLQRYTLTACEGLGREFDSAAAAIRGELRTLLADLPQLPDMTLMDDTPTANPQTRAWLREAILDGDQLPTALEAEGADLVRTGRPEEPVRAARGRATSGVHSGRPEKMIEPLVRALEREKSQRGRFLRQTELAGVMVNGGLEAVAKPILEELVAGIEKHKLEEWEAGELVAEPLALLYRCLDKLGSDAPLKESLYLRICRLDPLQALGLMQGANHG